MATSNDKDNCSISGSTAAKLYASIAFDYNAAKTNPFKQYVEEATFSSAIISPSSPSTTTTTTPSSLLRGQKVLDLGCGSGHYCRILKNKWNATTVHGVDVSEHMLAEATRNEEVHSPPLGIQYMQQDLLSSTAAVNIKATFINNDKDDEDDDDDNQLLYDLVTAEYLLPYAANKKELHQLCLTAASLVKPGGRFVSIVSFCSDSMIMMMSKGNGGGGVLESHELGWAATWEESEKSAKQQQQQSPHDGMLVELTLFGEGRSSRVSFPNYLWTKETINEALIAAGFDTVVEWVEMVIAEDAPEFVKRMSMVEVEQTPVGVFVARKRV